MKRRNFLQTSFAATTGLALTNPLKAAETTPSVLSPLNAKKRLAMVGTGHRGTGFWGKPVKDNFGDMIEFVGLCDLNPGRVETAKQFMGLSCPTFTNFDKMLKEVKPDTVIVTTVDNTHDIFIVKALEAGCDVITEKPMTTDEDKCQRILDAERRAGKKVTVGFNYRHSPHMRKVRELLEANRVGKITSVDFHWYLNVYHGADYFRRWHAYKAKGGSLWVHKASHHFDLLNWWLDSDPVEVTAFGQLENYGKNGAFRGLNCRSCEYKTDCKFHLDITKDKWLSDLYIKNQQHDGYFRDGCVFREDIDIYDKMSAQILYANGITVNYSLTTYSPYEGWRIAFNGMNGRLETWQDIPYQKAPEVDQANRHAAEMTQNKDEKPESYDEIFVMDNFAKKGETIPVPKFKGGHGGGDSRLHELIFRNPTNENPLRILAGTRDGAFSSLIGIAARKSIEQKRAVKISELTDLKPMAKRPI
ncbi:MAG: Gfo/Idh/MocA family oxidoreductase [Saprospiraceae bacterium]|nr:Gfo/Idh/MocA family oxidoreductase [Saprospiraceae bacterium]